MPRSVAGSFRAEVSSFSAAQLSKVEAQRLDVTTHSLGEQRGGRLLVAGPPFGNAYDRFEALILTIGGLLRIGSCRSNLDEPDVRFELKLSGRKPAHC